MVGQVMRGQLWCLLAAGMCAFSVNAAAVDYVAPAGVIILQAEDLIQLAHEHEDLILIDSRSQSDREMGYIEGSLSLPDDYTNCQTLSNIIKRLGQPTVFYCNGVKCGRSRHALQIASSCGYSNLYWFKGGYEEWREKHFPVLRSH